MDSTIVCSSLFCCKISVMENFRGVTSRQKMRTPCPRDLLRPSEVRGKMA